MPNESEQEKTERQRIQKYAELLAESGIVSVFEKKLKEIKGLKVLKESDIISIFQKVGINVESTQNIESWLPTLIEDRELSLISDKIALLKHQKDANGQVPKSIMTLYDFTAYINDDLENASIYKNKVSSELLAVVEANIGRYVKSTTDYAHAWTDLCSIAKNKIFDTDPHNKSYKDSLQYIQLKDELSEVIKALTDDDKRLSTIADILISKICGKGYSHKEAIALYNKIANLIKNNPYIPEQSAVVIKCEKCGTVNRFGNLREAENSNCRQCNSPLYMTCPGENCGKKTPISFDYCVHCNFFIAGIKNFNIYYHKALDALSIYDFPEARKQLANAKLSSPKDTRIEKLEKRIKDETSEFEKPIREIEELIGEKKLKSAIKAVRDIKKIYPLLNLSAYENELTKNLGRLDRLFRDSKKLSQFSQAGVCEQILSECVDYNDALLFLKSVPPRPCGAISCICDEKNVCINISWKPSPDKSVTYTLVRKEGSIPASPTERSVTKLIADTNQLFYNDSNVVPGKEYGYAVFSKRAEIFSVPAVLSTVLLQDVRNIQYFSDNSDGVIISWDVPANCQSVLVFRKDGCIPSVDDKNAVKIFDTLSGSINDRGLKKNCIYGYRIRAVYATVNGREISKGLTFTYKSEEKLMPFSFDISQKGLDVTVRWKNLKSGYLVRVIELKPDIKIAKDQIVKVSDIDKYGKTLALVPSEIGKATFTVDANKCFDVVSFAYISGSAIAGSTENVNTYLPITLESRSPRVDGNSLIFKLSNPIPPEAKFIYYGLKTSKPYWTEPSELDLCSKVSISVCRQKKNELLIRNNYNISGICYLTLYTEYDIMGKTVISSPDKEKIKIPMQIYIQYGIKAKSNRTALEIILNIRMIKGQIPSLPPLKIIANSSDIIAKVEEMPIKENTGSFKRIITNLKLPCENTQIKLVPEDETWLEDMSFSTLSWFNGKI